MKKKLWLALGGCVWMILLTGLFLYSISGSTLEEIAPKDGTPLLLAAQGRDSCSIGEDGSLYSLTYSGALYKDGDVIVGGADSMLPVGQGVAYSKNDTLYFYLDGEKISVAGNIEAYGQYGGMPVYAVGNRIYRWKNGEAILLTELDDSQIYELIGNDRFLAISCSDGLLVLEDGVLSKKPDIKIGSGELFFLWEDSLVIIGEGETGVTVCGLSDNILTQVDLGWRIGGDSTTKISVAASEESIYLSVHSVYLPDYDDTLRKGTYRIDPGTWTAEEIDNTYHSVILCGARGLYTLDTMTLRGKKLGE